MLTVISWAAVSVMAEGGEVRRRVEVRRVRRKAVRKSLG
jgi:hypothetical protein